MGDARDGERLLGSSAGVPARQPRAGDEIADELPGTGAVKIVVVDSPAALVPEAEVSDARTGTRGRLLSQALCAS